MNASENTHAPVGKAALAWFLLPAATFVLARDLFFSLGTAVFFALLVLLLLAALKCGHLFPFALLMLAAHGLVQTLFFPLASLVQDALPQLSFPCGLAEALLAACFGLVSTLVFPQPLVLPRATRLIPGAAILFLLAHMERFAFSAPAFQFGLGAVVLCARLCVTTRRQWTLSAGARAATLAAVLVLALASTLLVNSQAGLRVLAVQEKNAWATDTIPYDDRDWTLKSAYSYSLLSECMARRFSLEKTHHLAGWTAEALGTFDALFFMTPTKPFAPQERALLDAYLERGGTIVLVADHTDLYGHARAINSFLGAYGQKVRYDAVFVPHNRHAKALMGNVLAPGVRMMTSASIALGPTTAVLAFCHNFLAEKADYTRPHFFADMRDTPDDLYGTFPLVTVTQAGAGSIVVCSESTIFSNFGLFHPRTLALLDLLFRDNTPAAAIARHALWLLLVAILLLGMGHVRPNYLIPAAFVLLLVLSRTFCLYLDRTQDYYDADSMLVVQAAEQHILDPDFRALEHGQSLDAAAASASYLFSAVARFGIQPRFVTGSFLERLFEPQAQLLVDECRRLDSLRPGQKLLATTPCPKTDSRVAVLTDKLSDARLGNWWTQIGVSPYRKERVQRFADWIRHGTPIPDYAYPARTAKAQTLRLALKNDRGERKEVHVDPAALASLAEGECLLLEDGIWGLKSRVGDTMVLVGGDSFNDRRNAGFFARYWFGVLPDDQAF